MAGPDSGPATGHWVRFPAMPTRPDGLRAVPATDIRHPEAASPEDTYVLAGNLSTRDWRPLLGAGFDPAGVETLGGFVMSLLGRVPKEGESIERRGLRFVVEKMSGRRVARVRVERRRREGEA